MRNSKKLIAVIMTIAILASMMVPALAASYQTEADKLVAAGLMKGTGTGLDLESKLDRIQGIVFTIRAMGVEAAAAAMSEADIAAALANVEDADKIPAWGRPHAAYAVKNNITNGVGGAAAGKIKFDAFAPLSGKQFVTMMLRTLGYAGITLDNCLDKAVEVGMLGAGKTVTFGTQAQLNRDAAAYIIYSTVNNGKVALAGGVTPSATTLVSKLVADGALAATVAAANFTFTVPTPAPAAALTFSAVALNGVQFLLTFNQAINADDGKDEAFYAIDGKVVGDATVQADGKSVLLTITNGAPFGNNSAAKITVKKDFRNVTGTKLAADFVVSDIRVFDTTFPSFDKVEAKGLKTLRLYYSEPVWDTTSAAGLGVGAVPLSDSFEIKNSTYTWTVTAATASVTGKYIDLTLGTNLIEGTVNVKTKKAIKDYVGNMVPETTIAYAYVKDATAPVATVKSAAQKEVVISFNKPVYGDIKIAHSNKDTYVFNKTIAESAATDEITATFTSFPLPAGQVTIYVGPQKDKDVKDLYGNKLVETALTATVTLDVTAPSVTSAEAKDADYVKVNFDEKLDKTVAETASNYTLKKADGTSVVIWKAVYVEADKQVQVWPVGKFTDNTSYVVTVKKSKDLVGNENSTEASKTFTVGDNTAPKVETDTFAVNADGKIYLYFSEPMNATEMVKKANYLVNKDAGGSGTFAALGDNDTVSAMSDKIVLIDLDGAVTGAAVKISTNVVDLAGKKFSPSALEVTYPTSGPIAEESFTIDKAEAIAVNKIKITFTKEVAAFSNTDIVISYGAATAVPLSAVESISGKEVVVVTSSDMSTAATSGAAIVTVSAVGANVQTTKSVYGKKLGNSEKLVADKIAPNVAKTGDNYRVETKITSAAGAVCAKSSAGAVEITYTELMDTATISKLSYTVAGYTINAIGFSTTAGTGVQPSTVTVVTLTVTADADNTPVEPAVKQDLNVKDLAGNTLASGTTYSSKWIAVSP